MSVHREVYDDGTVVFVVRWREEGRNRGRRFNARKLGGERAAQRAAQLLDGEIALRAMQRELYPPPLRRMS